MKIILKNSSLEFKKFYDAPVTNDVQCNAIVKNVYFMSLPDGVSTLYIKQLTRNINNNSFVGLSLTPGGEIYANLSINSAQAELMDMFVVDTGNIRASFSIDWSQIEENSGKSFASALIDMERATSEYNPAAQMIANGATNNPVANELLKELYIEGFDASDGLYLRYVERNLESNNTWAVCFGINGNAYKYAKTVNVDPLGVNTIFNITDGTKKIYCIVNWDRIPSGKGIEARASVASAMNTNLVKIDFASNINNSPIIAQSLL